MFHKKNSYQILHLRKKSDISQKYKIVQETEEKIAHFLRLLFTQN